MDAPNAFLDKAEQPFEAEVISALGQAGILWTELIEEVIADAGKVTQEWQDTCSKKYGWLLRIRKNRRNIIYMAPCHDCFRVAFTLSDRAVDAAKHAHLPKAIAKALATAPHYPEGTGLRLTVKSASDLPAIRKLARIKLAN